MTRRVCHFDTDTSKYFSGMHGELNAARNNWLLLSETFVKGVYVSLTK